MLRHNLPEVDREKLRFIYCQKRHEAGLPNGTEAEIAAGIDRMIEWLANRNRGEAARPIRDSQESPPVQLSLIGADDSTRKTRANAAVASIPRLNRRLTLVAQWITQRGEYGATRDELEAAGLGFPIQSICPVVAELKKRGLIVPTSRTRLTRHGKPAAVMVARCYANGGNEGA